MLSMPGINFAALRNRDVEFQPVLQKHGNGGQFRRLTAGDLGLYLRVVKAREILRADVVV